MFIELDHTSSGVQIAAALARDAGVAASVNIVSGDKKGDLYAIVARKSNKALKAAGIDFPALDRKSVKTSVISKIYGASHDSVYKGLEAATGISSADSNGAYKIVHDVIKGELGAIVAIENYFQQVVKTLADAGHTSVAVTLPSGVLFTVDFSDKEKVVDDFDVHYYENGHDFHSKVSGLSVKGDLNVSAAGRELTAGYIQSLDAYILASVQVKLAAAGIVFLAKHDAYIVDEADADALLGIVKECFFDIFKDDLLAALHAELTAKYGDIFEAFDSYGTYDVADVLAADFIIA